MIKEKIIFSILSNALKTQNIPAENIQLLTSNIIKGNLQLVSSAVLLNPELLNVIKNHSWLLKVFGIDTQQLLKNNPPRPPQGIKPQDRRPNNILDRMKKMVQWLKSFLSPWK